MKPIVWNYGGGIQSVAIAVLIVGGKLPVPERALIADTGREKQTTWRYMAEHAQPLLDRVGLQIETIPHSYALSDLYDKQGGVLIPAFTKEGEGQLRTFCSGDWKRDVVYRWLREAERGYGPDNPIVQWLGYSTNEVRRCAQSRRQWAETHWPLILGYGLRASRRDCEAIILDAGLPLPKKSRCWCCPLQTDAEWTDQQINEPEEHNRAVELDRQIAASDPLGLGLYLHHSGRPLSSVVFHPKSSTPLPLFREGEGCTGASCFT
jgi:hypothetical protein